MSHSAHTPLPWHADIHGHIGDPKGTNIASTWTTPDDNYPEGRPYRANSAFIVKVCNVHYELVAALEEAREHIEDEIDVVDGDDGQPAPNRAMRLAQIIDAALAKAAGGAA